MLEAIALAGIFIDFGPVGMTRDKEGKIYTMKDVNREICLRWPVNFAYQWVHSFSLGNAGWNFTGLSAGHL